MAINEMMQQQHSMRDGADDDDDAASCSAPMLVSQQQRSMANLKERTYLSIYESGIASCRHTPYRAHHLTYRPSSNIKPSLDISFYLSIYLSWAPSLLLAVKIRMASVDSIKKITASMKLVAAARMKAAEDRMNRIRPFAASTELTAGASPSLSLSHSLTRADPWFNWWHLFLVRGWVWVCVRLVSSLRGEQSRPTSLRARSTCSCCSRRTVVSAARSTPRSYALARVCIRSLASLPLLQPNLQSTTTH